VASNLDAVRAVIEARLADNITSVDAAWTAADNVAWPGVDFDPPSQWARPAILWGDGFLETHGASGTNTVVGVLVVSLFARPGSGLGALYGWADTVRDLYDRYTGTGVEFLAASGPRQVNTDDTRWLQVNVSIPFVAEETS